CDPETRLEAIIKVTQWIIAGSTRLLCITGAAGAGKSALQQTIAENCKADDIPVASFFFSASDPNRNTTKLIIPTIAYQLGTRISEVKDFITNSVERPGNVPIFSEPLEAQIAGLVSKPMRQLQGQKDFKYPYIVILIDGLNECINEDSQTELLSAVKRSLLNTDQPFRVIITSRPEQVIRRALNPGGDLHDLAHHIQLSDEYDATDDIRRYLRRRLHEIGDRRGGSHWFTEEDLEALVRAASGQFICAITMIQYISEHGTFSVVKERLTKLVRGQFTSDDDQLASPLKRLDLLYAEILSAAMKKYKVNHNDGSDGEHFLLLVRIYHINCSSGFTFSEPWNILGPRIEYRFETLNAILGLEDTGHELLLSDLGSLMTLNSNELHVYHESFSDFLDLESRSKNLFVPSPHAYTHITKRLLQHIIDYSLTEVNSELSLDEREQHPTCKSRPDSFQAALKYLPLFLKNVPGIDSDLSRFTLEGGWDTVDRLLPSMYEIDPHSMWYVWGEILSLISARMKTQYPDVAEAMSEFLDKWRPQFREWSFEAGRKEKQSVSQT
ncbi:hypothetical protein EST38_g13040, partial [Candolleomyces aberdarensis]